MNVVLTVDDTNQGGPTFTGNWSNTGNITLNNNYFSGTVAQITLAGPGTVKTPAASATPASDSAPLPSAPTSACMSPVSRRTPSCRRSPSAAPTPTPATHRERRHPPTSNSPLRTRAASQIILHSYWAAACLTSRLFGYRHREFQRHDDQRRQRVRHPHQEFRHLAHGLPGRRSPTTRGGTLNFTIAPSTSGTVATTANGNDGSSGTITDPAGHTGILGTWASTGTSSPSYAAINASGQIVPYTYTAGDTLSTAAGIVAANGTENYTVAAGGTAGANASINTLQVTGEEARSRPTPPAA